MNGYLGSIALVLGGLLAYVSWSNIFDFFPATIYWCAYSAQHVYVHFSQSGTIVYSGLCGPYPYAPPIFAGLSVVTLGLLGWGGRRMWTTVFSLRTFE